VKKGRNWRKYAKLGGRVPWCIWGFLWPFVFIVCSFEGIAGSSGGKWNRDTRSDTQSFLLAMSQFSFIVTLVSTHNVLAYTKGLNVKLQGPYVDITHASHEIANVKETLKKARSNVNTFYSHIHSQAMMIRSTKCRCERMCTKSNQQVATPSKYRSWNLQWLLLSKFYHSFVGSFNPWSIIVFWGKSFS